MFINIIVFDVLLYTGVLTVLLTLCHFVIHQNIKQLSCWLMLLPCRHSNQLQTVLGVISKVHTSSTNERTFIWHFTPSLPPQTKVWSTMGEMYGRWLCTLSSFFATTCPNNVFCLTQGRFPGGSVSFAKWTRRQSRTVKEKHDFFFLSFFFCTLKSGWPV